MRSDILSVCVIAALSLGGAAFAGTAAPKAVATASATAAPAVAAHGTDIQGTIVKINAKGNYVVLSDGWRYHLPHGFALNGFKVGEKVSVSYVMKGKHHDVTAMTAA